ncbi:Rne/Rng family ribonuclease [Alteriqipengyuania sp. WL0013]|uniref:Rne/Rng family ribonuclease n=1 Tax=Alteriqipengyuania sp. WL0013 TaxID=3110773 RepID=UPI002BBBC2F1|nr:Rne/Rng family ribonuclease [Alteriqipengyuania sp. WL0013]MEB3414796.1 Rne/Rng family ribonuclease [Alteriqipengyuania sp. WL0013]
MATRMLIDARHPEETRVAVQQGNRIEEFDFESAEHKQIKGNIYLAKVTRVEPSLQAAFVDFGGNRHGFLAFSEIHPDYYQIPKDDRDRLLAEEAEAAAEEAALRDSDDDIVDEPEDDESSEALADDLAGEELEEIDTSEKDDVATIEEGHVDGASDDDDGDDEDDSEDGDDSDDKSRSRGRRGRGRRQGKGSGKQGGKAKKADEVRAKRLNLRRRYKIQDVIQRRQVLLVQVVKEERGNKGAALTTYLSLAGRYTVLMPNSSHGGGISRKISSASDRKRLKQIVGDLSLPKSMGLIVRTAGLSRTKTEIKRDFDYLARLWDEIRERTMASSAPAQIHSDSDLIKRAIRDIYNREIEEVLVEGDEGYKSAKAFMKLLMPSHARRVKQYADPVPLFQRYGAEDQLKAMYDPVVQLKSGGYLVINPTEALVSIDINSGRSTKEHGIEATATATNLEAAKEIARQLRLRDMAGLVVIDFIDMEYNSNVRKVERCMKDALKNDRARIQVGRISSFGLMEMSRQRLRTGVLEATTRECPHCDGTGLVRTASSAGLSALRLIEDEAAKGKGTTIKLAASTEAAVYLLNEKRADLVEIEQRYGVSVEVVPEGEDEGAKMSVSSHGPKPANRPKFEAIIDDDDDEDEVAEDSYDDEDEDDSDERQGNRKRRRRGGRGRNKKRGSDGDDRSDRNDADEDSDGARSDEGDSDDDNGEGKPKKRRRRGGRGRRGRGGRGAGENRGDDTEVTAQDAANLDAVSEQMVADIPVASGPNDTPVDPEEAADKDEKPKKRRSRAKKAGTDGDAPATDESAEDAPKPKRKSRAKKADTDDAAEAAEAAPKPRRASRAKKAEDADAPEGEAEKPKRKPRAKKAAITDDAPEADAKPKRSRAKKADAEADDKPALAKVLSGEDTVPSGDASNKADEAKSGEAKSDDAKPDNDDAPRRGGWWQRTFGN